MIEKSVIIAMIIFGLHYIMYTKGMILYFVREAAENTGVPLRVQDPLFACPICMCPWWGTLLYWLFLGDDFIEWGICVFTAMGINSVIVWVKAYRG